MGILQKKILPLALTASMMLSATPVLAASSDLDGHWAKAVITEWQDKGLIKGYADGTFKPNNSITRAEFVVLMNNAQGYSKSTDISFTDVAEGDWYYDAVAKAVKAGYTKGYSDGTFQPNKTITRAEAAVMIANAAGLSADESGASFTDAASIPAWAKGSIGAAANAGYLSGYPDGSFGATKSITRAEAVSSLNRMLGAVEVEAPVEEVKKEDVVIKESGTTLENEKISGDLIIDEAVGEGEVYLNSVEVDGDLIVKGGGKNSVYLTDSTVNGKIDLQKNGVHLHISGNSNVSQIDMSKPARVTFDESFEGTVNNVNIPEDAPKGDYTIEAEDKDATPVENLNIEAETTVTVNANTTNVNVGENAEGSNITVSENATIGTVNTEADATIDGKGSVENLNTNGNTVDTDKSLNVDKTDGNQNNTATTKPSTSTGSSSKNDTNKSKTAKMLAIGNDRGYVIQAAFDQKVPINGTKVEVVAITAQGEKITLTPPGAADEDDGDFDLMLCDFEDFYNDDITKWNMFDINLESLFFGTGAGTYTDISGYEITVTAPGYSFSTIKVNNTDTLSSSVLTSANFVKGEAVDADACIGISVVGAKNIDESKISATISSANSGLTFGNITKYTFSDSAGIEINIEGTPNNVGTYAATITIPASAIDPMDGYNAKDVTMFCTIRVVEPTIVTVLNDTINGDIDQQIRLALDEDFAGYVDFVLYKQPEGGDSKYIIPTVDGSDNIYTLILDDPAEAGATYWVEISSYQPEYIFKPDTIYLVNKTGEPVDTSEVVEIESVEIDSAHGTITVVLSKALNNEDNEVVFTLYDDDGLIEDAFTEESGNQTTYTLTLNTDEVDLEDGKVYTLEISSPVGYRFTYGEDMDIYDYIMIPLTDNPENAVS